MILGMGLDLTEIRRFTFSAVQRAWFERRIFTATEMAYAHGKRRADQHLAGSFAAKEAFRKAYGGGVPWRSVGVTHNDAGAPVFALAPDLQAQLDARGVAAVHLSITHSREHASAVVIFEGRITQGSIL